MAKKVNKEDGLQAHVTLYETLLSQKTHEGDLVWSRFSGFVVTHSIFFAVIGQILIADPNNVPVKESLLISISILGLLLSILWLISTIRGFESVTFWTLSAVELSFKIQNEHGIDSVFRRGKKYFLEDGEVEFSVGEEKPRRAQRSPLTQQIIINTRWTAYLSISFLLLSYIVILYLVFTGNFS